MIFPKRYLLCGQNPHFVVECGSPWVYFCRYPTFLHLLECRVQASSIISNISIMYKCYDKINNLLRLDVLSAFVAEIVFFTVTYVTQIQVPSVGFIEDD